MALGVALAVVANGVLLIIYRLITGRAGLRRWRVRDAGLFREVAALRLEVDRLKTELEALKPEKTPVSPYNQALELVQQGLSAGEVALSCGITKGEAELLIALFGKSKIRGLE